MGTARRGLSFRGLLVGVILGAILGLLMGLAVSERPRPAAMTPAEQFRGFVAFAAIVAVLGGLAGGVLSRDGWKMLAGAAVGAATMGVLVVVSRMPLKGLMYSILGAPIGAVAVYLYFLDRDAQVASAKAEPRSRDDGIWDRDLDQ